MKNKALIIFIRNPQLGKVKTRLAQSVGDQKALEIYKNLLLHTMTETENLACDKFVFYDEKIQKNDLWSDTKYKKREQSGTDLGMKMLHAFQTTFELGYHNCIIIGSDLLDLTAHLIEQAFIALECKDIVIGPAEDGGYYLLGLHQVIPSIFKNKNWGSSTILAATLNDLKNYTIEFTTVLNDIDTLEDLQKSNYDLN